MEKRSLMQDEWLIILAGTALLCLVLSVLNHGWLQPSPMRDSDGTAPATRSGAPAQNPASFTTLPAATAGGPLTAKSPGRWVVDQRGAPDSDTPSIAAAVQNASPGDQVLIRAGTYDEHVEITKSLTLTGDSVGAPPTIMGTGGATIAVANAEVTLQNLSVAHKPNPGEAMQPAIYAKDATLTVKKLDVAELDPSGASNDACLVLSHSKLDFRDSAIGGCAMGLVSAEESGFTVADSKIANVLKIGVSAAGRSDGRVERTTFTHAFTAIALAQHSSVKVLNVKIADGSRGVEAGPDSSAVIEDSEINDESSAGILIDGAVVRVERTRISRSGFGIAASHRTMLTVSGTKIIESVKEPYHWEKNDGVQFSGGGNEPEPQI
jgi:hypothetical protein